jgi:3-oxoadipate enol-lactonase
VPKAKVNGITLHYEVEGSGPPLLLVSGLGGNRNGWVLSKPLLTDDYTVITFDNRGTGESDVPPGPYEMDQLGDDTAALIEHLDLGPVSAVGWSMGGCVLQSMLIHHPERLTRAVLLSTLPSYTPLQHHWLDAHLALRKAGVDPLVYGTLGAPWGTTPKLLFDHDAARDRLALAAANPYPTSYEGYKAQADGIRVYDALPDLHRATTPTLVLVGAEDVLTPPSQSIQIAERIPGARLEILPRGSHGMLLEYLPETAAAIRAFLDAPVPATA